MTDTTRLTVRRGREVPAPLVNEEHGKIFCLVVASSANAANTVHREARGLVADEIYAV